VAIEWVTQYPTDLDTTTQMAELDNYDDISNPAGDSMRATQLNATRDAVIQLETLVGSDNLETGSLRGQSLVGRGGWNYLDTTMPAGIGAPTALYQFDGTANSIKDRGTNGLDLYSTTGETQHIIIDGVTGFCFDGTMYLMHDWDAHFWIYTGLTIEIVLYAVDQTTRRFTAYTRGNSDLTRDYNYLWSLYASSNRFYYFAEYGNGSNISSLSNIILPEHRVYMLTFVRADNGEVDWYLNGQLAQHCIPTGGSIVPTHGTSTLSKFAIGNEYRAVANTPLPPFQGAMFSYRLTPEYFTAAQVLESYNRVRGT